MEKRTNFWDVVKSHPFVSLFAVWAVVDGVVAIVRCITHTNVTPAEVAYVVNEAKTLDNTDGGSEDDA